MILMARTGWCLQRYSPWGKPLGLFLFMNFEFTSLRFWHFVHIEDIERTVPVMRRKTVVWAYLLVLSLGTILSLYIPKNEVTAKAAVTIPGDAIRLRILANSDLEADQVLKRRVRDAVNAKITGWVQDLTSKKEARNVIKSHIPELQATAEDVVKQSHMTQSVNVEIWQGAIP